MGIKSIFSFVSIGTENSGSNGYMSVSEVMNGRRLISPIDHNIQEIDENNEDNLEVSDEISIECLCMLRFQLISSLALKNMKDKVVCIYGCGAIGIGAYLECKRQHAKSVTIVTRRKNAVEHFKRWINIEEYDGIKECDIYIDCTGDEKYIYPIIDNCACGSIFYELGTPRTSPCIDLLVVHRKNLSIMGGHELNGVSKRRRREECENLNKYYIKNRVFLEKMGKVFVKIHKDVEDVRRDIYSHKYIEPFNVIVKK